MNIINPVDEPASPVAAVIANIQELVAEVPGLLQPLIVLAAAAIPFVEGEIAALVGVLGGLHPVVAGLAAAAGNFLCVLLVVHLSARARGAVVGRVGQDKPDRPKSKGRLRFDRWVIRFGVPGASMLAPLAIPTQFTAATLVASGVPTARVIRWQAVAIAFWTVVATVSVTLAIAVAT